MDRESEVFVRQRGQAMVEYVAGAATATTALLVLLAGDPSPADQLLEAFKQFWSNFSFMISMP